MARRKCINCELKPQHPDHVPYCHNCALKVEAERRRMRPSKPDWYLVYRDIVVGLFPSTNGNGEAKLRPRLLKRQAYDDKGRLRLPRSRTLELDGYCRGYSREQVKRFKRVCLQLGNPRVPVKVMQVRAEAKARKGTKTAQKTKNAARELLRHMSS